jgi:hypothetical protein
VIEENLTVCETCHTQQKTEATHSTHRAVDMDCLGCHKNTDMNTGHTFQIGSDTCVKCHSEKIHSANAILNKQGLSTPQPETEDASAGTETPAAGGGMETPTTGVQGKGAGISIPWWAATFFAVVVGVGGYLFFWHKPNDRSE